MKRIGEKGTDALTVAHKLVGFAWLVSAVAVLWYAISALRAADIPWERVALIQRFGAIASVVTVGIALVYGLWTAWGFFSSRWLFGKWLLFLFATATGGYAIRAARQHEVTMLAVLTTAELASLAVAMGVGVFLERSRHAGRLP